MQIELARGIVLSAGRGAVLVLTPVPDAGDALAVTVLSGPTMLLNPDRAETKMIGVGTHMVGNIIARGTGGTSAADNDEWTLPLETLAGTDPQGVEWRQGLLLADGLMVRQQQYMDKLKIDVTAINRLIVSFIRSAFPR